MNCSACKSVVNKNSDICKRCKGLLYNEDYGPSTHPLKPNKELAVSVVIAIDIRSKKKKAKERKAIHGTMTKAEAMLLKGGSCVVCGYDRCEKALSFHHLHSKEHQPSTMFISKLAKPDIISELNKCVLVCNNCHAEIHAGIIDLGECL